MRKILVLLTVALLIAGYVISALRNESLQRNGETVLLRVAPVDPRALLMGDYMELDLRINRDITDAVHPDMGSYRDEFIKNPPADGRAVIRLNPDQTASFVRVDDGSSLQPDERYLKYRFRNLSAFVTANAFYFQEGHARDYERGQYAELKVRQDGTSIMVGLRDSELQIIKPRKTDPE